VYTVFTPYLHPLSTLFLFHLLPLTGSNLPTSGRTSSTLLFSDFVKEGRKRTKKKEKMRVLLV
jgi:hypothetical protein